MNHLFSVIIPCYNATNYIDNCMESLSLQFFKDFDVIVVDDCSNDGTYELLKDYVSKVSFHLTVLHNDNNEGPAASRKIAAEISTSEYLCFCDADDTYDEDFLQNMSHAIIRNRPSLIISGYKLVMSKGLKTIIFATENEYDVSKERAFVSGVNSLCVLAVNRGLYQSVKHPDIRNGEDMAVIPLLISNSDVIDILSNTNYNYNCRQGSASRTPNMNVVESLLNSFHHIEANLPLEYQDFAEFLAIKNVLYGCILNLFKFSYNTNKARMIITEIEQKYPRWYNNKYFSYLPRQRRFFVYLIKYKCYLLLKIISELHKLAIR